MPAADPVFSAADPKSQLNPMRMEHPVKRSRLSTLKNKKKGLDQYFLVSPEYQSFQKKMYI